jgi:glutamine amidotransferase
LRKVCIVDYGLCNLDSVARAIEECGGEPLISHRPEDLRSCDRVIIPGVGAFGKAVENLRRDGMDEAIGAERERRELPVLGICLGMQLLADASEEGGNFRGLGLISGRVVRLQRTSARERVPHVGWNEVEIVEPHPLLKGLQTGTNFYFVHSYHFSCARTDNVLAATPYCGRFASIVAHGNVMGVQFHPEKSQKAGFQLLRNFLAV